MDALYVAVAQYDHLLPKAAQRLSPHELCHGWRHSWPGPQRAGGLSSVRLWVQSFRQLITAGAHCYVIAQRKLDEQHSRLKADPCDATTLCHRLSRSLEGNTRELALIRVPSEEEEQASLHRG